MKGNGKPSRKRDNWVPATSLGKTKPGVVIACNAIRGFTKVEFTAHALEQMKIRGLARKDVLRTIADPHDTNLPTQPKRCRFRRYRNKKRAVDVVFEEWEDRIVVVTAMIVSLRKKDQPDWL